MKTFNLNDALKDCVIMSGDNPVKRSAYLGNGALKNIVISLGYTPIECVGKYAGKIEASIIIPGLPIGTGITLGRLFGQESILHIVNGHNELVYIESKQRVTGNGIVLHSTQPTDNFTQIGQTFFTCNLNF